MKHWQKTVTKDLWNKQTSELKLKTTVNWSEMEKKKKTPLNYKNPK